VYFNDQPISSFPDVRISGRMGNDQQTVLANFADTETLVEVGVGGTPLEPDVPFLFTTTAPVNAVVVRIRFPDGVFSIASSGQLDLREVRYRIRARLNAIEEEGARECGDGEYCPNPIDDEQYQLPLGGDGSGPGPWTEWSEFVVTQAQQSSFFAAPRLDSLSPSGIPVTVDIQVERITALPPDVTSRDRMLWDSIVQISYSDNSYGGYALLAIEAKASEQLQDVPRVSVDIEGLASLRIWDGVSDPSDPTYDIGYSSNPADLAFEVLTNKVWGLGALYGDDNVDTASLLEWRTECDLDIDRPSGGTRKQYAASFVIGELRDGIEWLRTVCATGRCVPVPVGSVWRFLIDRRQDVPVEVFTDGSLAVDADGVDQLTYRREYALNGYARPNQLVAQIENDSQAGEADTISYPPAGELWLASETAREESIKLEGVTDLDQIAAELAYRMSRIRFLTRSIRFTTTKPVVVCQPGDRIDVAMSMPGWGFASGRVLPGSSVAELRLDRTLALTPGTSYNISVTHLDGTIEVRSLQAGLSTVARGSGLSVSAVLDVAPQEGAEYSVGEPGAVSKPFTVTGVRPANSETLEWEIEAVEYTESIYDADPGIIDLPDYSTLNSLSTPPGPVVSLRAFERFVNNIREVQLSWSQQPVDAQNTASYRIYRRSVGTTGWLLVPEPRIAPRGAVIEIVDLDRAYEFAVVAVSLGGSFLSPNDPRVPIARLVFGLTRTPPGPPENLMIVPVSGNTYRLEWDEVADAVEYQVLTGGDTTSLPNAGAEDCLVLARTGNTSLDGLELAPGRQVRYYVRSVSNNGRLSFAAASVEIASPATPPSASRWMCIVCRAGARGG